MTVVVGWSGAHATGETTKHCVERAAASDPRPALCATYLVGEGRGRS